MKRPDDWLTYVICACAIGMAGLVLVWFVTGKPVGVVAFLALGSVMGFLGPIRKSRHAMRTAMTPAEAMRENVKRGLRDEH